MQQPENPSNILPPKKATKNVLKIIKHLFVAVFIIVASITIGGIIMTYYYQDEVKNYIISEVNKQLNTQVIIDGQDIQFTVLKNFPLASIEFNRVAALDAIPADKKDTLFKAKEISLQFNIIDIFNKNYKIKTIIFRDANLTIRIDKDGKDNYHFWKTSKEDSESNFSFELTKIIFENVELRYTNHKLQQQAHTTIQKAQLSGKFSNDNYSMNIASVFYIHHIRNAKTSLMQGKKSEINILFDVDNRKQTYTIRKGKIRFEELTYGLAGSFNAGEQSKIDVTLTGQNIDIQSALSLIPSDYKSSINDYRSTGDFYFNATIKGDISKNKMPEVSAEFGINNAAISQANNSITLQNVNLKGWFSSGKNFNPTNFELHLNAIKALLNNGEVHGDIIIKNFQNPFVDAKLQLNVALNELHRFIHYDTVENISGQLKTDFILLGRWEDIKQVLPEKTVINGSLELSNLCLKIKNRSMPFENINGVFDFDKNNVNVKNFTGNMANSDFYMHGTFKNVIRYLFNADEKVTINATFNAKQLNLDELLENKDEQKHSEEKYKLSLSENIDFTLNSTIQQLIFRQFKATNIKGVVVLKNKKIMLDSVSFNTMDGNVSVSGIIDGSDSSKLHINSFSNLKNINVTKLFASCENFGQEYITDSNIKGICTASIQLKTAISTELDIDLASLYALIDMSVEQGELNNVESMKSLSRFVELQELMNVRFATLKNQFEIKNKNISFPKMEIQSNALSLLASGTHHFDNTINYKIKLTLNELLAKKARKNKKQNDDFGEVADDGLGHTQLFLSMTGKADNPTIKYDTREALQTIKQTVKSEKQTVKGLLKEEFRLFKKDTTIQKTKPAEEKPKFKIEWEEDISPKEEKKELKAPKRKTEDDF